jgi:recombination protein RecA
MNGAISTGSLRLDLELGIGGIPRGSITELFGPEASGKTTLCHHIITEAQKWGGVCAWIDGDHTLEPLHASHCGVDPDRLYVCEPACAEQALEIAEILARSGGIEVLVIDSILSLAPRREIQGRLGGSYFGVQSRLLSFSLQKLSAAIRSTQTAIVLTTQGPQGPADIYHPAEVSTARLAIKLHSSLRLELAWLGTIPKKGIAIGDRVQIRVRKNKFGPNFRTIVLELLYNEGVIKTGEILDIGIASSLIVEHESIYSYRGLQLGMGRESVYNFLRHHPAVSQQIEEDIRQQLLPPAVSRVSLQTVARQMGTKKG